MRDHLSELRKLTGLGETALGERAERLPEDPWKYFIKTPKAVLVPVAKLQTIRARESGIAHAEQYMAMAHKGEGTPRKPITLKKNDDGTYTVCDGNSTTAVAKKHGWKQIPAELVSECPAEKYESAEKGIGGSVLDGFNRLVGREAPNEALYEGLGAATVDTFLTVLSSKLMKYDASVSAREAKRGSANIYRLGLLLAALDKVRASLHTQLQSDAPEVLKALKDAIGDELDAHMPPVKATLKQIDDYLATGKKPSLVK